MNTKLAFHLIVFGLLLISNYSYTENDIAHLLMNFEKEPELEGWVVSHSFLDSGLSLDAMPTESEKPFRWLPDEQSVRIQGVWLVDNMPDYKSDTGNLTVRYVLPIDTLQREQSYRFICEFEINHFGNDRSYPITIGMFNQDFLSNQHTLSFEISEPETVQVTLVGSGESWPPRFPIADGLKTGVIYRAMFESHPDGWFRFTLSDLSDNSIIALREVTMPDAVSDYVLNEIGIALQMADSTSNLTGDTGAVHLRKISLSRNANYQFTSGNEVWANPLELRDKRMISTGLNTSHPGFNQILPRFLVENPEFGAQHPFDGIALQIPLDPIWCESISVPIDMPELQYMLWTEIPVPYDAIADAVHDLKQVEWGQLTDNFLYCQLFRAHCDDPSQDSDGILQAEFDDDADWAVVEANAALMARICRETGMKGILFDTEQYNSDPTTHKAYPMGMYEADLLRQRGAQWIRALQKEFPEIIIVVFFSWYFDEFNCLFDGDWTRVAPSGFLEGTLHFLDGILEGIEEPALLVNAHENTFYFGQKPGSRYTAVGFSGDRLKYQWARNAIQSGRLISPLPDKYDRFVETGMAAWVESDPWNLTPSWPSGYKDNIWSNLPLALAYSDRYVWVWSEHTHYSLTIDQINPFLASLANQTYNTGKETPAHFSESFLENPVLNGWYFDFDMLDIGRDSSGVNPGYVMSVEAIPYVWLESDKALRVIGSNLNQIHSENITEHTLQRRRYVRPILPLTIQDNFTNEFHFLIEQFGTHSENAIVMGLFNAGEFLGTQSVGIKVSGPSEVIVQVAVNGNQQEVLMPLSTSLSTDTEYRLIIKQNADNHLLTIQLCTNSDGLMIAETNILLDILSEEYYIFDESGIALMELNEAILTDEIPFIVQLNYIKLDRQ